METHLVLAIIGRDRPGLVNAVSEVVTASGGNWLDTRMASLSGQFAGILLVSVPSAKADALITSLKTLESQGLKFVVEKTGDAAAHVTGRAMTLELVGADRPGIVREVSGVLSAQRVSNCELETERVAGSFSGEPMFMARARLQLPDGLGEEALRRSLESLGPFRFRLNQGATLGLCLVVLLSGKPLTLFPEAL
jgi:glycine cleavage system regulatory protein